MAKGALKITLATLLAVLLAIVPLLGISQWKLSGLLADDDITVSNELAEGQLVTFEYKTDSTADQATLIKNMEKTAEILRRRLSALGYRDSHVDVISKSRITVTLPANTNSSIVKESLSMTGDFLFKGGSKMETLISSKDIENCVAHYTPEYDAQGNDTGKYSLAFFLTEEALNRYIEKTTEISNSNDKKVYLYVDDTQLSELSMTSAITDNGFSFGPFEFDDALWFSTMINAGPLPQTTLYSLIETVEPELSANAYSRMFPGALIAVVLVAVICVAVLKLSGIATALSLISSLGLTLAMSTMFGLGVSLTGVCAVILSAALCLLLNTVLLRTAKQANSSHPFTCLKLAFKQKAWLLVDLLVLPFAIALAMMWYGNVFTLLFANLLFIGVISAAVSLLITLLTVSAIADLGKKRECAFGN